MDKKRKIQVFKRSVFVIVIVFIISFPIFIAFRLKTEGRLALREAKNVKLHIEMMDVRLYGQGSSVFDSSKPDGMKSGVLEEIRKFMENNCDVRIVSYNKKDRKVTSFLYTRGRYQVIYVYDELNGDTWTVRYSFDIYNSQSKKD